MLEVFKKWYERYLQEEESILLLVLLVVGVTLLVTVGDILTPLLAAIVLAYLVQGLANVLLRVGLPQWLGFTVAFVVFVSVFFGFTLGLLPLAWRQLVGLFGELPRMLEQGRQMLGVLPQEYPELFSQQQINQLISSAQRELADIGQNMVKRTLAGIPGLLTLVVYMILVPIMVFFFLKDRQQILGWLGSFLPRRRPLLHRIWDEMNVQFANYARGKIVEIVIVGVVSYVVFIWFGLNYAALLALLVGLSVIIPYIGAFLVTIPILLVAFFQWGVGTEFYSVIVVYMIIQILDGNVLVPLLFSEAVNLHPVAIIVAVLFFGGIWGMWGVFFAIPLATLIKSVINAWPTREHGAAGVAAAAPAAGETAA
jgi:putative permease